MKTKTKSFLILALVMNSLLSTGQNTVAPYKIEGIKAYLFYYQNKANSEENVAGTFSENIIDNESFDLWNTIIGAGSAKGPSNQTLVIVKIGGNPKSYVSRKITLTATANDKIILKKTQEFAILDDVHYCLIPFLLYDTGCEQIAIKAEIINNQTVESRMTKQIDFECGE